MMSFDRTGRSCRRSRWPSNVLAAAFVIGLGSGCASTPRQPAGEQPNPFFVMDTWFRANEQTPYPSFEAQLDLVRELGYDGFGCKLYAPAELQAIARNTEARGLKLFSVYTNATLTPEGLTFDPHLHPAMEVLEGHRTVIWLTIRTRDFATSSPDGDAAAVASLRELADSAAKSELCVSLYPHAGDWMERLQDAVRLARKAGRDNLGVTFNLCHCLKVGDEAVIPQLLADAGPYLSMVTINGADGGAADAGWDRLIQPLDRGTYDLLPLLEELAGLGYTGPIGLQGYGVKGDVRDNLSRSMDAWRDLSANLRASERGPVPTR